MELIILARVKADGSMNQRAILIRVFICLSVALISLSILLFLLLPAEFLRIEDGLLQTSYHEPLGAAETSSYFDKDLVGHVAFSLPPDSSLTFQLAFPFPPWHPFHMAFSAAGETIGELASLRIEAQGCAGREPAVLFERTIGRCGQDFSLPLPILSRRFDIKLSSSLKGLKIKDLRITPLPLIPMIVGLPLLLMAVIALSRLTRYNAPSPSRKFLRHVFAVGLLLAMLLCIIVALEAFIRIFPSYRPVVITERIHSYPLQVEQFRYGHFILDKELGFKIPPHYRCNYTYQNGDLFYLSRTRLQNCVEPYSIELSYDADGFRNRSNKAPADVVFLGDSFVEAPQVPKTLCEHFQDISHLYCANLGLSCIGTTQEKVILKRYGFARNPKVVILIFFEANDFYDNYVFEDFRNCNFKYILHYYRDNFNPAPLAFYYNSLDSILVLKLLPPMLLHGLMERYVIPGDEMEIHRELERGTTEGENCVSWGKDNAIELPSVGRGLKIAFYPHYIRALSEGFENAKLVQGWRIATRELEEINSACVERNIRFLVCCMPSSAHVYLPHVMESWGKDCFEKYISALVPDIEKDFMNRLRRNADLPRRYLGEFCRQRKIPFIDLYPYLEEESAHPPLLYICNDTHLTPYGHEIVARCIYQWIQRNEPEISDLKTAEQK